MKIIIALLVLLTLSAVEVANGQGTNLGFPKGKEEVYFLFRITSHDEIPLITNQVSIDNVRNDTVWAYANMEQFMKFSQKGYNITLLPSPGDVPDVLMSDNIQFSPLTTWNFYPTYSAYESLMADFQANYPGICQVTTIATLASGRKILVAKISDNVSTDESEPEFLYTSSIHGDETTGYILMLHLMDYLLSNYGTNQEVTDLVNNLEIFINPLANPDGTYHGGNSSVSGATRYNANSVDLNRNYPDFQAGQHPDGYVWQPETVAFMDFATQHHFVASCNFHGGAEVVNYPWDTWYTLHADDNWWQYVSREYADTVHINAPGSYMSSSANGWVNGITNGAVWYIVHGGRQDYMNYYQHCREFTIELSNTKLLPANQLENHWTYNWRSLILYMKQAGYGIHGIITSTVTEAPVAAKVFINGHDIDGSECYSSANNGDYHRLLKAGTYTLEISAPCYQTQIVSNVIVTDKSTLNLDIQLLPSEEAVVTTTAASDITGNTAVSGGNVLCEGSNPILARGICWSTANAPTIAGNHTTDGSGTGSFISSITGLSATTIYHIRSYATNSEGTVYGDDLTFTTLCGIYPLPLTEVFSTGSLPACWTTQFSGTGALNKWTVSNTAHAGGTAYEMKSKFQSVDPGITRLVTVPLNTLGMTQLNLSFRHMLDAYSAGCTLRIQSSTDGINWTNEAWSVASSATNIAASQVNTTILNNLNSSSTLIGFTIEGNLFSYDYWYIDDISISGNNKTLNLTLYLEGLFNGTTMNKSKNATGDQYAGNISDQITVELHNSTSPYSIAGGPYTVNVNTDGTASVTIPASLGSGYFIVVKHRNSVETWTASPISFSGATVSYNFSSAASQAYGNNMKLISGKYVIYTGDVNQDGIINSADLNAVNNDALSFQAGYTQNDANGDGMIDSEDMIMLDNNSAAYIQVIKP